MDCDVLIKSAAPSDYRPEKHLVQKDKEKANGNDELNIKFVRNQDIAAYFGKIKQEQIMVGFAAETDNLLKYAEKN